MNASNSTRGIKRLVKSTIIILLLSSNPPQKHGRNTQLLYLPSHKQLATSRFMESRTMMPENGYRISSPISLVIFSVFDTEICEIFHQKWGSAYSQGFAIKKKLLNLVVLLFFWTTRVCLKVSKY